MIYSLQILRFIAASLVVFAHYEFLGYKYGGFGVDIFFIISGFVIGLMLEKDRVSPYSFIVNRAIRIIPMYYLATAGVLMVAFFNSSLLKSVHLSQEALFKSLFFIPYRVDGSGPVLSLGWTLNVEMFFYLFACISLFFKRSYLVLVLIILIFVFTIHVLDLDGYFFEFYRDVPFLEFFYGLILYGLKGIISKDSVEYRFELIALISILIYLVFTDITGYGHFGHRMFWRGIPAFFIVALFFRLENLLLMKFDKSIISILGAISYAMYLFHPFVVFGIKRILLSNFDTVSMEFIGLITSLSGTIMVSYWVWTKIELPFTNKLRSFYVEKE